MFTLPRFETLNLGPNYEDEVAELNDSPFMVGEGLKIDISENALSVLRAPAYAMSLRIIRLELAKVSFSSLKLKGKVTLETIFARASEVGLEKCPPQTGPRFRLKYLQQPEGLRLAVGMEPISSSGGFRDIFTLDRERSTLWLRAVCGNPNALWDDEFEWLFAVSQPKQPKLAVTKPTVIEETVQLQVRRELIEGFQVAVPGRHDAPDLPILLVCNLPYTDQQVIVAARKATIKGRVVTSGEELRQAIELASEPDTEFSHEFRRDFLRYLREGHLVCAIMPK